MKKTKGISFLLAVAMLVALLIPGTLALSANAADAANNGMYINKTATANDDGTYTIQLEAYATGSKVITETKKDVPTDIVLVLDQSGSMTEKMNTYSFRAYSGKDNGDYYNLRHNGSNNPNLYYQLGDGSYASVSVTRTQGEGSYTYTECPSSWQNDKNGQYGDWNPDDYWKYSQNLYVKSTDGQYQKVMLTRKSVGEFWEQSYTYTYEFPDGSTVVSEGSEASPNFGDKGPLYVRSAAEGEYTYTYTYTDSEGQTKTIGTSEGADTQPTDFTLYERYVSSNTTRLEALQTAVTNFADSVKTKAAGPDGDLSTATDNVNHRVAVVGFATGDYSSQSGYPTYENTEVFVGSTQYNYNVNASSYYSSALQDMNTQAGYNNVIASKNALAARGATYPNYGLEMAKGILDANPVQQGETRNRVVILFTDGSPGYSSYSSDVASSAVTTAKTLKDNGVTVYSVGIFTGADASSAGIAQGNSSREENQFMQDVSSNNGTPQNPSYYLSASDADTLNNIFQQISDQIESGGTSSTLTSESVVKDIIAPEFTLPKNATAANITLETYACTGKSNGKYTWTKNTDAMGATVTMGATATVDGDKVNVTGFDFSKNYVAEVTQNGEPTGSYQGHKLVITFTVQRKPEYLGGNSIETNTSAGIYENKDATEPIVTFPKPMVNVPINRVVVANADDQNVYLYDTLTGLNLREDATVTVGGIKLDLTKADENYGLADWQTAGVDIAVAITDKDGNAVTDETFKNLTEDSEYNVSVTVSPKNEAEANKPERGPAATPQSGNASAKINVFKPVITWKDSQINAGQTPDYEGKVTDVDDNLVSVIWKHGETLSTAKDQENKSIMDSTEPALSYDFDPAAQAMYVDTPVDVTVLVGTGEEKTDITRYVTFVHEDCNFNGCKWEEAKKAGKEFIVHMKTCDLVISKSVDKLENAADTFIFTVAGPNGFSKTVVINGAGSVTIADLPIGSYTVTEDTAWSWRYECSAPSITKTIAPNNNTFAFTNTFDPDSKWLTDTSYAKNLFGTKPATIK